MISLNAAITIAILSLVVGGCISAAWRNLRGMMIASRNDVKRFGKKSFVRYCKRPFRGAIYAAVGVIVWFLDLVAIFLSVR